MLIMAVFVIVFVMLMLKVDSKKATEESGTQDNQQALIETDAVQNSADVSKNDESIQAATGFYFPLVRAKDRVTKKPFGIYITSQNSPVQPERFQGYHTGTDFETFPDEQNVNVSVYAVTSGKILAKKWVNGYGGIIVENATLNNSPVTIIYGHLNLSSINKKTGENLSAGEQIGYLGKDNSRETDGERKHLHLGIYKGSNLNILGYAQSRNDLNQWIDPMSVLP